MFCKSLSFSILCAMNFSKMNKRNRKWWTHTPRCFVQTSCYSVKVTLSIGYAVWIWLTQNCLSILIYLFYPLWKLNLCLRLNLLTSAISIFLKYHFYQDSPLYKRLKWIWTVYFSHVFFFGALHSQNNICVGTQTSFSFFPFLQQIFINSFNKQTFIKQLLYISHYFMDLGCVY